jgi:hypothetical protein
VTGEIQVYGSGGLFFLTSIFSSKLQLRKLKEELASLQLLNFVETFYIINTDF